MLPDGEGDGDVLMSGKGSTLHIPSRPVQTPQVIFLHLNIPTRKRFKTRCGPLLPDGEVEGDVWEGLDAAGVELVLLLGGYGHHVPLHRLVEARHIHSVLQRDELSQTPDIRPEVYQVNLKRTQPQSYPDIPNHVHIVFKGDEFAQTPDIRPEMYQVHLKHTHRLRYTHTDCWAP